MYTIERREYVRVTNLYTLDIDESFVKEMNDYLSLYEQSNGEPIPELTAEDIINLEEDNLPEESILDNMRIHKINAKIDWDWLLMDSVHDYISDAIWESPYELIDGETYDWEQEIYER